MRLNAKGRNKQEWLPLTKATRAISETDPPHEATVGRWARKGIEGVRLKTWMRGGRRGTTIEALEQFFAAVTAARDAQRQPSATESREEQIQQADSALDEMFGDSKPRKEAPSEN